MQQLLFIFAASAFAQYDDGCTAGCSPFDLAAELDAACPNGNCTNFYGGNYTSCYVYTSVTPDGHCWDCENDAQNIPHCIKAYRSASCSCEEKTVNYIKSCKEGGSCRYS